MKRRSTRKNAGIALMILIGSLAALSLVMKELLSSTSLEAERIRNMHDRIQALYLARSAVNLGRFLIFMDTQLDKLLPSEGGPADTLNDPWAKTVPFPVPLEWVNALLQSENSDLTATSASVSEAQIAQCQSLFENFQGTATVATEDLSARLDLNSMENDDVFGAFMDLLTPNVAAIGQLQDRGIRRDQVAREIRDYIDADHVEKESNTPEEASYRTSGGERKPKNRRMSLLEELKMIPSVDEELYEYLSKYTRAVFIANQSGPAKINLNTVSQEVFQSLLTGVSNPEEVAEAFIKDRQENSTIYHDGDAAKILEEKFQLNADSIRQSLLGGRSQVFQVTTTATVGRITLSLVGIVVRGTSKAQGGNVGFDPVIQWRISP